MGWGVHMEMLGGDDTLCEKGRHTRVRRLSDVIV